MNTTTHNEIVMLGLHIGVGGAAPLACQQFIPERNWIGSLLLARTIKHSLALGGIECDVGSHGALNDCLVTIGLAGHHVAEAVEIIKYEIRNHAPMIFQIGISRDGHWSCIHPDPNLSLNYLFDDDRMLAAHEAVRAELLRLGHDLNNVQNPS